MATGSGEGRNPALRAWTRALETTAPITRNPSVTLPIVIERRAETCGSSLAFLSEQGSLTYAELAERSWGYARWALQLGLAAGDVVALLMRNCPDYMAIWLGLTSVGAVVALVNHNLAGAALAHSIRTVSPSHVILDAAFADALAAVRPQLDPELRCWAFGPPSGGLPRIDEEVHGDGQRGPPAGRRLPSLTDRALYIFTSGTTGLPKAASVSHLRAMQWSHWFAGMLEVGPEDRMYNCLPMYHSIGGVVATGAMLVGGGSVVLRQRFSATRFWDDVVDWDCTLFQYIGELCRYLLNTPPHPREREHKLRLCCGNGLRADVWEGFRRRFAIPQILEFYAATEGSFSLFNAEGEPGAIGRIPSFLAHRFPVVLVKHDVEAGRPVRGEDGFCIRCTENEVGEAIGRIGSDAAGPGGRFEGYTDEAATRSKVLRDAFAPGDAWFRTGDLMRRDGRGFFYFIDRIGDTFRWKGENVSTAEVAEVITGCSGVAEAVVYGVAVPGAEGRAGMAAMVPAKGFDMAAFRQHLIRALPDYARPVFLRLRAAIDATSTFKPDKQILQREGFDPAAVLDELYIDDRARGAFVRLDADAYERIRSGTLRL